ncbi:MAG TPA: hypothetical protein VND67_00940 [Acidimicrobiales bacterium]|nr:hypothetical protein [Acidimicrobiales bacterium]
MATEPSDRGADRHPTHRIRGLLLASAAYLLLSVIVWWNVWSTHPTSVTTCGCGDSSLFTWFLEWPAYALAHGLNPLYSTAMFHPGGINLLSNTSELAFGIVLAPVTWIFGPIATLNVADTLSPVLTASAMYLLLRRWVSWSPAAFVGGLLYGFSPLVMVSLTDSHLMLATLLVPPLIVGCLDELFIRQRRNPILVGALLGLLVGVQFFIGTEVLAIMAITGVIGVVLLLLYAWRHPTELRRRRRHAIEGLAAGGAVGVAVLAYPLWFALAGPAHLSGAIWTQGFFGLGGTTAKDYLLPLAPSHTFQTFTHNVGGYQGLTLSGQYFGIGLVVVLVAGSLLWRHDRRLWLFGGIGAITVALSLGRENHFWVPWRVMARIPLVQNIIPGRFVTMTYLCAAIMLALIVDHVHRTSGVLVSRSTQAGGTAPVRPRVLRGRPNLAAWIAGVVVSGIALVPFATYLGSEIPFTAESVVLPRWFTQVAPTLDSRQVLLVYPLPFAILQSALTWQAVDHMQFSMAGGSGPGGTLSRAGSERRGQAVLSTSSLAFVPRSKVTAAAVDAVRHSLDGWGVTMVVIPDQADLPKYETIGDVPFAVGLITAATGERPVRQADAWVWTRVDQAGPPATLTTKAFNSCVVGLEGRAGAGGSASVPACVLHAASVSS